MSNLSLANPGTSLNFDGQALQNQQEDEYRKEEEQQQHELRQLITNAFDDLIDDDDILSITSEEGTDSRNVSLVRHASNDSFTRLQEDRIDEQPENEWAQGNYTGPTSTPMLHHGALPALESPRFETGTPLSHTQEFQHGGYDSVRASVESLRGLRRDLEPDLLSNPSVHSSREQLDKDYHSNKDFNGGNKVDFHGNVYPLENSDEMAHQSKGQSQKNTEHRHYEQQLPDHHSNRDMIIAQRQELIRKSIEDLNKMRMEAYNAQQNQQYYHDNVNQEAKGHEGMNHNHQQWHAEQPYDHNHANHVQQHLGQGHFHGTNDQYDPHYQGHPQHQAQHHHHFRNIYEGRPYHTIGEREETEGGNINTDDQFYHLPPNHMGFYRDTLQQQEAPRGDNYQGVEYSQAYTNQTDGGFYSQTGIADTQTVPAHSQMTSNDVHSHPNEHRRQDYHKAQQNDVDRRHPNDNGHKDANLLFSPRQSVEYPEGYKVSYRRDEEEKPQAETTDKNKKNVGQKGQKQREEDLDADFLQQDGSGEVRELAQLQILYKARGRKIEEQRNEMEVTKQETAREIRILKHQLSVAKGEKEGLSKSLESVQELLQANKTENAQLVGRLHATESQLEGLKKGREELIKKLQTSESAIETLQQHLDELGSSESLARARHEHDVVVSGLQQKYETEIKVLKEKIERQVDVIKDKDNDIIKLKQNLAESLKSAENLQVSRAETINRLTQSLEESQKRCRNLLESSSSQDLSQMKIQLQQSLAARTIADEMCASLQDEVHDLKEQLQMMESASSLGALSQGQATHDFQGHNDSLVDLGIKKTLDFETPQSSVPFSRDSQINASGDVVSSLKAELERCLISNRQKRNQVTELKDELKVTKKDLQDFKQRCEQAELLTQDQQRKINELESLVSPGDHTNAVENRLKKDISILKREKEILLEDIEELKKRLEEVAKNEERLSEINRDLNKQIADMVKEYDQDKREALERVQRACEQVGETSRDNLRQELTLEFDVERSSIISRYEKECNELRTEVDTVQAEMMKVKDLYVEMCEDKEKMQTEIETQWETKLHDQILQIKEDLMRERDLSLLRMEEELEKKHEENLDKIKTELKMEHQEKLSKLENEMKLEKQKDVSVLQEKLEKERVNELAKIEQDKQQEIERLKKERDEEMQRVSREKELEVRQVREDMTENDEILRAQVREEVKKELEENMAQVLETKIAMSKVVWLEEHRATRQTAIDNAVRLAETELRMKLDEEMEATLQKRLEEAKLVWQGESFKQLEEEKTGWELLKAEEMATRLAQEHETWRQTELLTELETEKQKWARELEQKLVEDNESWRQVELEAEKLKWTNEWAEKMKYEKENWVKNELEPAKRQWKLELDERLRLEKENWRCMELETEKLKVMQEMEGRINQEKKMWMLKDLPTLLEKEKKKWTEEAETRFRKEKICWRTEELPVEIEKEKKMWLNEMEVRINREKESVRMKEIPLEVEKEKKKWLTEMEEKLNKEKQNWKTQELSSELERERQTWMKGMEVEMEKRLQTRVEEERERLDKENENKLLEAIEEHQEACKVELQQAVSRERERLRQRFDSELQDRFTAEKKVWKEMVEQELNQKLEIEREKWKQRSESVYRDMLDKEKMVWKQKYDQLIEKVEREKEEIKNSMLEEFDRQLEEEKKEWKNKYVQDRQKLDSEKAKLNDSFEVEVKTRLESEIQKLRTEFDDEFKQKFETEKELLSARHEAEMSRKLQLEEENWKLKFETELNGKLQEEEKQWKHMIEQDLDSRLRQERDKWANILEAEKNKLRKALEEDKTKEVELRVRKSEEGLRLGLEKEFNEKLHQELERELQDARDDWHREYSMELSINTSSAEASQCLLKEEIENLKQRSDDLQAEMLRREEAWQEEKQEIVAQKDAERRKALSSLQDQNEAEYKQFLSEHQDTLNQALKTVREQHNKEKMELEERFNSELKQLQEREKLTQHQLQETMHNTRDQSDMLLATDTERITWLEERDRLLQDIADRDTLLGKADVHLSKEVEKLRSELQATYQRRLDSEMSSWKQKVEAEYNRMSNAEQKEKLQLEKQLSEVNTELQRVKKQTSDDTSKHTEQIKRLTDELNEKLQKSSEFEKIQADLKRAKDLCQEFQTEALEHQQKCHRFKKDAEDAHQKVNKLLSNHEKLYQELQKVREEKTTLIESVQTLESSYRKDISLYKQKIEESALRIAKTEKVLQDMKQRYRSELESVRKALETENDTAMEAMKNKMVELQKKHVTAMDLLKQKYIAERDELLKLHGPVRDTNTGSKSSMTVSDKGAKACDTETEENSEEAVLELRTQYLDTVTKIKDDVLRHITETNVRAAETVKSEMVKERTSTFQQIKDFYKENVRQILQTEVLGSNLENKLMAVEDALETLSSNPSSRCTTPRSEDLLLDEVPVKSRTRGSHDLYPRDAGAAPHSPRQVTFSSKERSRTPVNVSRDMPIMSPGRGAVSDTDVKSPKSRGLVSSQSPRHVRTSVDRDYSIGQSDIETGVVTPREGHRSDHRSRPKSSDSKKGSRVMISSRDVHSGRYNRPLGTENVTFRARSTIPHYSSEATTSNLQRPTSVPDLSVDDKELKLWNDSTADSTYRYTPLRETLRTSSNLQRSNSKSESDLHIAEKLDTSYGMYSDYKAANLDLSSGSISSCDTLTGLRSHDAGEAPTATPRRHFTRTKLVLKSLQLPDSRATPSGQVQDVVSGERTERKNLPLIQFRHGKVQNLPNRAQSSSKSPHVDSRKSPTSQQHHKYRPLSVSATLPVESDIQTDF